MTDDKPRQRFRKPKTSRGSARGAKKTPLTPLQGVLINNSGPIGHQLRGRPRLARPPKKYWKQVNE